MHTSATNSNTAGPTSEVATAVPDSMVQQKKLHISPDKEAFSGNTGQRIGILCGFVAVATEWLTTHHCLLSILDGLDFMFGEKHWNRGAIKCLDTLMEGRVDY